LKALTEMQGSPMDDTLEQVILVDMDDREIGRADKLPAHRLGYLHRAVSICVVDDEGRMLIQRRAASKYHSAGLWANACCSHPRPGEATIEAALRRLPEELGFTCPLFWTAQTHYRADVGSGLTEDELVHIFVGVYNGEVKPEPNEVDRISWITYDFLKSDILENPQNYTYWFRHYIDVFGRKLFEFTPV
jgi:isopentenyl-diphosphate delta-isomerase